MVRVNVEKLKVDTGKISSSNGSNENRKGGKLCAGVKVTAASMAAVLKI